MRERAERSVLSTPGSNPDMIAKALATDADLVMIDLEDAVAPEAEDRGASGSRGRAAGGRLAGETAHLPHERAGYALVRARSARSNRGRSGIRSTSS